MLGAVAVGVAGFADARTLAARATQPLDDGLLLLAVGALLLFGGTLVANRHAYALRPVALLVDARGNLAHPMALAAFLERIGTLGALQAAIRLTAGDWDLLAITEAAVTDAVAAILVSLGNLNSLPTKPVDVGQSCSPLSRSGSSLRFSSRKTEQGVNVV